MITYLCCIGNQKNSVINDNEEYFKNCNSWGAKNYFYKEKGDVKFIALSSSDKIDDYFFRKNSIIVFGDIRLDYVAELREKLKLESWDYASPHLILEAYNKWGDKFIDHIYGDFSFSIYDEKKERLLVFRDQFGIKPVYYCNVNNTLMCCSDLRLILNTNLYKLSINENSVLKLLTTDVFMVSPLCEETFFKDIYKLLASRKITYNFTTKKVNIDQYYSIPKLKISKNDNLSDQFLSLMKGAVKSRCDNEKMGSELSGGLDSSIVTTLLHEVNNDCIAFTNVTPPGTGNYEEQKDAIEVANYLGISNHFLIGADDYHLSQSLNKAINYSVQPNQGLIPLLSTSFYQAVEGANVKILFSGLGGDECVTHHGNSYLDELLLKCRWWDLCKELYLLNNHNKIKTAKNFLRIIKNCFANDSCFSKKFKNKINIDDIVTLSTTFSQKHNWKKMINSAKFSSKKDNLFSWQVQLLTGQFSHPLQARLEHSYHYSRHHHFTYVYPMFDRKVIEFMINIPGNLKIRHGVRRYLPRLAMKNLLPERIRMKNDKAGSVIPAAYDKVFNQNELLNTIMKETLQKETFSFVSTFNYEQSHQNTLQSYRQGINAINILQLNRFMKKHFCDYQHR